MPPSPGTLISETSSGPGGLLHRLLGVTSFFTMLMTIPQVLTIWLGHQAGGVSLWSWCAYLVSAVLWLCYGLRRHAPNIYLACIGWIMLDSAVIIGVLVNH
jgi:uncharacterized protein with PQ loop repeat